MNATAVRCDGLVHIYRSTATEVVALRDVDLVVEEGETIALLGPSGAGKSTLLWLLAGLFRPSAGRLWLHGREMSRLSLRELDRLRAKQIGMVQAGHLLEGHHAVVGAVAEDPVHRAHVVVETRQSLLESHDCGAPGADLEQLSA